MSQTPNQAQQTLGLFDGTLPAAPAAVVQPSTGPTSAAPTCALCKQKAPAGAGPGQCRKHWNRGVVTERTPACADAELDAAKLAQLRAEEEQRAEAERQRQAMAQQRTQRHTRPAATVVPQPPAVMLILRVMPGDTPDNPVVGLTLGQGGQPPTVWKTGAWADAPVLVSEALAQCPALLAAAIAATPAPVEAEVADPAPGEPLAGEVLAEAPVTDEAPDEAPAEGDEDLDPASDAAAEAAAAEEDARLLAEALADDAGPAGVALPDLDDLFGGS